LAVVATQTAAPVHHRFVQGKSAAMVAYFVAFLDQRSSLIANNRGEVTS